MGDKEKHFLVLDVGSTTVRAHVFNSHFEIIGSSRYEVDKNIDISEFY